MISESVLSALRECDRKVGGREYFALVVFSDGSGTVEHRVRCGREEDVVNWFSFNNEDELKEIVEKRLPERYLS